MLFKETPGHWKKGIYAILPIGFLYSGLGWECHLQPEHAEVVISPESLRWAKLDTADLCLTREGGRLHAWIDVNTGPGYDIATLYSEDNGKTWTDPFRKPIVARELPWESFQVTSPHVIKRGNQYEMWYAATSDRRVAVGYQVGHATSPDRENWAKAGAPVVPLGNEDSKDKFSIADPCVLFDGDRYRMFYSGADEVKGLPWFQIWEAESKDGKTWANRRAIVADWIMAAAPEAVDYGGTTHLFYVVATAPGEAAFLDLRYRYEKPFLGFGFSRWNGETLLNKGQLGPVADHSIYSPCVDLDESGVGWMYLSAHDHLGVWRIVRMPMTLSRTWFGWF